MEWIKGNKPNLEEGQQAEYIVARQRPDGKVFTFVLTYANRHVMGLSDSCWEVPDCVEIIDEDHDEYMWSGWFDRSCEQCDTQWKYQNDAEIIAHMPIPDFNL